MPCPCPCRASTRRPVEPDPRETTSSPRVVSDGVGVREQLAIMSPDTTAGHLPALAWGHPSFRLRFGAHSICTCAGACAACSPAGKVCAPGERMGAAGGRQALDRARTAFAGGRQDSASAGKDAGVHRASRPEDAMTRGPRPGRPNSVLAHTPRFLRSPARNAARRRDQGPETRIRIRSAGVAAPAGCRAPRNSARRVPPASRPPAP